MSHTALTTATPLLSVPTAVASAPTAVSASTVKRAVRIPPLHPLRPARPGPRVPPAHRVAPGPHATAHAAAKVHEVSQLPSTVINQLRSPAPLENPWLAASVLAAAAVLVTAWVVLAVWRHRAGRRTPHPVLTRVGLGTAVVVLFLAGSLLAVNSYAGYIPTTSALGNLLSGSPLESAGSVPSGPAASAGTVSSRSSARSLAQSRLARAPSAPVASARSQIVQLKIGAGELGVQPSTTYVYLPAGYTDPRNAAVRYPVVYLIHGYPGQASDWLVAGRAQQAADLLQQHALIAPMIMVFPTATGGWLHDSECLNAVGAGQKLETYLTRVVVNTIDRTFRTIPSRSGRAIGGMSSGGYCALNLGLRHLAIYSTILSSMPYGDPGPGPLRRMLGGSMALFHANSPSWYVSRMAFPQRVAVFLDASTDDRVTLNTARTMAAVLAARGQYVALRIAPGLGHTWREARAELPYSLVFASQHLSRRAGGVPLRLASGKAGIASVTLPRRVG